MPAATRPIPETALMTIGHSTHPIEEFLDILNAHSVDLLVDVRTIPKSRRNPQFSQETLGLALRRAGIDYLHMPELGGLRRARKDSINTGWKNASFRGYADYVQTREFVAALNDVLARAAGRRAAVMCAEAVPWRCHRSLIADALLARNVGISHITSKRNASPHRLTPFAKVEGTQITYPSDRD